MSDTLTATAMGAAGAPAAAASSSEFFVREHHPENGTLLGFWLYLMSDCLVFACLFATYAVLGRSYAGGPTGAELFDLPLVALNTSLLLLSSITYGFSMLEMQRGRLAPTLLWLAVTGALGAGFVGLELHEFAHLIADGAGPQRSTPDRCATCGHVRRRRDVARNGIAIGIGQRVPCGTEIDLDAVGRGVAADTAVSRHALERRARWQR